MQSDGILKEQPNVILLHAGTNDNWFEISGETYADAPNRLGIMVDYILCNCPDAVLLVAVLIANKQNQTQTDYFNSQVPSIVGERYMKGFKIRWVDQRGIGGDDMVDLLHPNDAGYELMAENWLAAIENLPDGWITAPGSSAPANGSGGGLSGSYTVQVCEEKQTYFSPWLNGNQVAAGVHVPNDPEPPPSGPPSTFSPGFGDRSTVALGVGLPGIGVYMADLNGNQSISSIHHILC